MGERDRSDAKQPFCPSFSTRPRSRRDYEALLNTETLGMSRVPQGRFQAAVLSVRVSVKGNPLSAPPLYTVICPIFRCSMSLKARSPWFMKAKESLPLAREIVACNPPRLPTLTSSVSRILNVSKSLRRRIMTRWILTKQMRFLWGAWLEISLSV